MRSRFLWWPALVVLIALSVSSGRSIAASQQRVVDATVSALIAAADKASLALQFDEALTRIEEAIAAAQKVGDRLGLATAHRLKGVVYARSGRSRDAIVFHQQALAEFEALGDKPGMATALISLATAAMSLGDQSQTREFVGRALLLFDELGDERGRAWLELEQQHSSADVRLTDSRIDSIVGIAKRIGDDSLLASALMAKANSFFGKADYKQAVTAYEVAIDVLKLDPDLEARASAYVSLGRVFRAQGDYEGALARYQQAIDLLSPTKERYAIVEATNAAAIALGYLNRQRESIAMYEKGLALAHESGNQRLIDFMEGNLAGGYLVADDYAKAIPLLESVISRKPEPSLLAYRQNSLALSLTSVGRAAEALPLIDDAVRYSREAKLVELLADRLESRSLVLKTLRRFDDALVDIREAIGLLDQMRTRVVPADYLKRGYADSVQYYYRGAVDILSLAGRNREALEFAEQGRSRAFLDLLAARETSPAGSLTMGGGQAAGVLASEALGKPADLAGMEEIADRLKSTILEFWVNDDATIIWVVRAGAEPVSVRVPVGSKKLGSLVAATTSALREALSNGTATTRGAEGAEPAQTTDVDLLALPMRGLGLMALSHDDKKAWRELYKTLIEPVRAQLPARGSRLTIVPHGPLFQLSFAALQNAAGRYLLEDYELHYAPAISALAFTGRRQQEIAGNRGPWAIVGNPETLPSVGTRPLSPLPGAAREIATIAAIAPKGSAVRLDGAGANESALGRMLNSSNPSVLHFATHGFVFDDPKQQPFLALNRRSGAAAEDGRLTLDEVYGLRLNTDLVVLSACRSGSGNVTSDGVIGLTRGFFYAGSPSVLATFWDVTDETTATLMSGFYRRYLRTQAKGASLRSAQLALLADLRAGNVIVTAGGRRITLPEHPLLWAAFFLSGEP